MLSGTVSGSVSIRAKDRVSGRISGRISGINHKVTARRPAETVSMVEILW